MISFRGSISEEELQQYVDERLPRYQDTYVRCYLDAHPIISARITDLRRQRQLVRAAFLRIDDSQMPNHLDLATIVRRVIARRRLRRGIVIAVALLAVVARLLSEPARVRFN